VGRSASSWAALAWCGDAGAARLHVEREARIASVASEADVEAVAAIADAQNRIVDELNRFTRSSPLTLAADTAHAPRLVPPLSAQGWSTDITRRTFTARGWTRQPRRT